MELNTIIILTVVFFMLYTALFFLVIFYTKRKEIQTDPVSKKEPLITIIVPVYQGDEKKHINKSVISATALSYPKKEIILAWNGPKNANFELCKDFVKKGLIKLVYTPKAGKAAGMNEALKHVKGEYFCCLDADSFFSRDALQKMTGYLDDPKVSSVTSAMKAINAETWIQKIQWVEYVFAIYIRKMMAFLNALYVVPGPGSMYKTQIIKDIGGFDENNLTEDMEIAFRLQKNGYRIENSTNAYVETNTPRTLVDLVKQRIRWFTGFLDNVKKYKFFVLNPKYGSLGMYMIPASLIWIVVLFYTLGMLVANMTNFVFYVVKTLTLTGFHWDIILKKIIESIYLQPTFMTWFIIVFTIIGIGAVLISLWVSDEKVDIKGKYLHYLLFMFIYTFLVGIFWFSTITYIILRKKTNVKIRW